MAYVQQQTGRDEAEPLAVAHLVVVHRVRFRHFEEHILPVAADLAEELVRRECAVDVAQDDVLALGLHRQEHAILVDELRVAVDVGQTFPENLAQLVGNAGADELGERFRALFAPDQWLPFVELVLGAVDRHLASAADERLVAVRAVLFGRLLVRDGHVAGGARHLCPAVDADVLQDGRRVVAERRLLDVVRQRVDRAHLPAAVAVVPQLQIEPLRERLLAAAEREMVHQTHLALRLNRHRCFDHEPHRLLDGTNDQVDRDGDVGLGLLVQQLEVLVGRLPARLHHQRGERGARLAAADARLLRLAVLHRQQVQQPHVRLPLQLPRAHQHPEAPVDVQDLRRVDGRLRDRDDHLLVCVAAELEARAVTWHGVCVLVQLLADLQRHGELVAVRAAHGRRHGGVHGRTVVRRHRNARHQTRRRQLERFREISCNKTEQ